MTSTARSSEVEQSSAEKHNELSPKAPALASAAIGLVTPALGRWTKIHLGLLMVALAILVVAGQGQHFFYDEWAFVGGKRDAIPLPDRYLLPHNEHWSLLPLLAYRMFGATVGVGSYWPYLGLLLVLHLGVTHVLWRLMLVTGSKPIVATALAAVFSVLGAGAEDLVWAFQIGFVGSTLLGVSAVYIAVTGTVNWRRTGGLAALTLAGLATSGVGLAYLVVVPFILARRQWRHAAAAFALPLLAYVTWYSVYGHSLDYPPTDSAAVPLIVGAFVVFGLTAAVTSYFGFGIHLVTFFAIGVPVLAGLTLACRTWRADRTLVGRTPLAMFGGAVVFFGITGLARAGLGLETAASSRYLYVVIALLLPAIALVISGSADRHPRLIRAVVPIAVIMAISNVLQLFIFAADFRSLNTSPGVLVAASDLARGSSPIFSDQLPEPYRAPDLTLADLRSGHLDAAFEGVTPGRRDRLTASINLQIQVAPVQAADPARMCDTTREHRITIPTNRETAPTFMVIRKTSVTLTLSDGGARSAGRVIVLPKGTYVVNSLREASDLTIESSTPAALLARC